MTSTLFIVPDDKDSEWAGAATFKMPVKSVFGRALCDTDGSIGYPTNFTAVEALEILKECKPDGAHDVKQLAKVRKWAEAGKNLFATWKH